MDCRHSTYLIGHLLLQDAHARRTGLGGGLIVGQNQTQIEERKNSE
jgi:hypothetical protein